MIKVAFVTHPLDEFDRAAMLEIVLQNLEDSGSSILHITSDTEGYTIVYREGKKQLND